MWDAQQFWCVVDFPINWSIYKCYYIWSSPWKYGCTLWNYDFPHIFSIAVIDLTVVVVVIVSTSALAVGSKWIHSDLYATVGQSNCPTLPWTYHSFHEDITIGFEMIFEILSLSLFLSIFTVPLFSSISFNENGSIELSDTIMYCVPLYSEDSESPFPWLGDHYGLTIFRNPILKINISDSFIETSLH